MPSTKDYSIEVAKGIESRLNQLIETACEADFWLEDLKKYLTKIGVDKSTLSEVYGISKDDLEELRFESYQRQVNNLCTLVLSPDPDLALSGLRGLRLFLTKHDLALSAFEISAETVGLLKKRLTHVQPQNLRQWLSTHLQFC